MRVVVEKYVSFINLLAWLNCDFINPLKSNGQNYNNPQTTWQDCTRWASSWSLQMELYAPINGQLGWFHPYTWSYGALVKAGRGKPCIPNLYQQNTTATATV